MSIKKVFKEQPDHFEFSDTSLKAAEKMVSKYPKGKKKSAVMSLLYIAQRQNDNWIPLAAMKYIAKMLEMPYIKVYEVATFYSMYNLSPVGKYFFQVCTTTPCMIRDAYKLVDVCKKKISENESEISSDGKCSWMEVECLGACINAPVVQINEDYFEDLTPLKLEKIIDQISNNEKIKSGSYRGRTSSEPENSRKTLLDNKNA
ncbi:MAG: NADH-quinone oxidoreductase subunit E [Candidatus Pelagibacter sp. TMED275]|nr:MAG: NADH-quinone oxidoreductase subunit E [Candidatus Pelagibacter sp. TMED275]|tara:strand:- start:27 stop:635 length:609 start_codon:yes stop_codon:yes gene_type:complete